MGQVLLERAHRRPWAVPASIQRRTTPRPDGLPSRWVLWWFPALVTVLFLLAVGAGTSGSSTGMWWETTHQAKDPNLIMGTPRAVRSDEWLVQGSWLVSQDKQGFPATNHVFPGGMDATVMNDSPTWDWSTAFRPHLWGSLVLGLDRGLAFRWWFQAWIILVSAYLLVVSLLPRRTVVGALIAGAVVFQPMVQWWWFPATTLPIGFAFATMTAVVWAVRCSSLRGRAVAAGAAGYSAVSMAMSIYAPYMLGAAYPVVAFTIGYLLSAWRHDRIAPAALLRRLVPLIVAAITAGVVTALWALTRWSTVKALFATVYPGQRVTPPGLQKSPDLVGLLSGPMQGALRNNGILGLGPNQSEAAVPVAVSLFLVVPMLWILWARWRHKREIDWLMLTLVLVQGFVLAYEFVPGWDLLAKLTLVDRSTPQRLRLAFVVLDGVSMAAVAAGLTQLKMRTAWWATALTAVVAAVATTWAWRRLDQLHAPSTTHIAAVVAVALVLGLVVLARRHVTIGVAILTACTLAVGLDVNPLYRGMFDAATQTTAGRAVVQLEKQDPTARWVALGSWVPMGTLFEAAVPAYSGVQTYPSQKMWTEIDPGHLYETAWNRLAHLQWSPGTGDPDPRQPPSGEADLIELTFDSCAPFAQKYVTYVLGDTGPVDQPCLRLVRAFPHHKHPEWIYQVVPARAATPRA